MKRYEIDGMIFTSLTEALNYCDEQGMSEANISEYEGDIEAYCKEHPEDPECKRHRKAIHEEEEKVIEESPEENPIEDSEIKDSLVGKPDKDEVIDETTLIEKLAVKKALETFDEWDDTAKKEILQQALNLSDKSRVKVAKLKATPKRIAMENYVEEKYRKIVEDLADRERTTVCPICNRPFEEGLTAEELSFWKPDLHPIKGRPDTYEKQSKKHDPKLPKVLENVFPRIRQIHVATKHPAIWEFIKTMFGVPKEMPHVAEPYASNPESCTEDLSREELTEEISRNPELRNQLFRKWKRKLQERN